MDGQHRVKEVGHADLLGLGDEAKEMAVPVEGPGESVLEWFEAGLIIPMRRRAPTRPVGGVLYVSSTAESPNHLTLTTSMGSSGVTPPQSAGGQDFKSSHPCPSC